MHRSTLELPSVDVVVPCYNYGHFLRACVSSVLDQEGVSVRVLIIDDCSSDDTPQVGQHLAVIDSRVEYRRHEVNRGHIATYNEGIEWIENEYFILLSADDMLIPGALNKVIPFFERNPELGLVYGDTIKFFDIPPLINSLYFQYTVMVQSGHAFIAEVCQKCENPIASPAAAIVRGSLQKQIGGYLFELPHSGDLEMWLRFSIYSDVGIVNAPIGYYRQHGINMSSRYYSIPLAPLEQHRLMFELFFAKFGDRLPNLADLEIIARKTLAAKAFWTASAHFDNGSTDSITEYLDFVSKLDREFVKSWAWKKLRYKRALGAKIWKILQPLAKIVNNTLARSN